VLQPAKPRQKPRIRVEISVFMMSPSKELKI
jgi:hypothetical protein